MPTSSKPQILIVDDEPAVRTTLGTLLMSAGYDVAMADNGASAVSQLSRTLPDLILTDLCMPQMSGIELISHIRSRYPKISVIAMSGDYEGDAVPASVIADRFYAKGQNLDKLLTTIASLIAATPERQTVHESRAELALDYRVP
jgi:CheY-like chemotaxis protein